MAPVILDGFAGPGGWSEGLRLLGLTDVGLEWDASACATRVAAGHATIRCDVAQYPKHVFAGKIEGMIMSPPCQAFSKAGNQLGLADVRGQLIYQVLEWADALRPLWIACEQVPQALPIWKVFAPELRDMGYKVWHGMLDAVDYGAPQYRQRAIMMCHLDRPVNPPDATHAAAGADDGDMFSEPLQTHVTMAQALGWRADGTVYLQPGTWADPDRPDNGYHAGHRRTYTLDEPAPTLHFGHDSAGWKWRHFEQEGMPSECGDEWPLERPASTIMGRGLVPDPGATANAENGKTKSRNNGFKVEDWQAGILQTFPADYPWQGPKVKRFQQVGNAVPPVLAAAIVKELAA